MDNTVIEEETIPKLEPFDISTDQVTNAIKHFPISSSGGIDGLRTRHLKDFSCGESATKLTEAISKLTNVIRSGKICSSLTPIFFGAELIAFAKKNSDIRPIAIELTLKRLAGKISCFSNKIALSRSLLPFQNGISVKGDAQVIVHAVRA
ncbi:hypothetical protein Bhyg_13445 [Pseudolycoriella hygida]|uniref:Uncharacterized protein n=1 Tax=Pseudolycoriella hygida TaxID=35572 RepID=A0A9Q0MQ58_9DIPT|nr:hypothetical protein Bhyg_13445 [Pseudolycoriella hygida]